MTQLLNPHNLKLLYDTISHRRKERFDIILEPLQSILQVAFLSVCPDGSKLTIHKNLLKIQIPDYTQPFIRWYQNDNKEDLFYLFYVCKRFSHFYSFTKEIKNDETNLYDLLIQLAKEGLETLIRTYGETEKISLLHTLELYKVLLENPNQLTRSETKHKINSNDNGYQNKKKQENIMYRQDKYKTEKEEETKNKQNIEDIFINITKLYKREHLHSVFNTLVLIHQEKEYKIQEKYMKGINTLLEPVTNKINKWIHNNIVF